MLTLSKLWISDWLCRWSMDRHKTPLEWGQAVPHTKYWRQCRDRFRRAGVPIPDIEQVETFREKGVAALQSPFSKQLANEMYQRLSDDDQAWGGEILGSGNRHYQGNVWREFPEIQELCSRDLEPFLTSYFGCHFKIFLVVLYKSANHGQRTGSQMWHTDTVPGNCVNMMYYLHPVTAEDGPLKVLPWEDTMAVYWSARRHYRRAVCAGEVVHGRESRRDFIASYTSREVERGQSDRVCCPVSRSAGLMVPFMGNLLHAGGYPAPGRERMAITFRFYPSDKKVNYERYSSQPSGKGFPHDPAADF
jgi:ectoine hydroxylase-related dioxygenase (phytanoyl-CoA dioxygenase family)